MRIGPPTARRDPGTEPRAIRPTRGRGGRPAVLVAAVAAALAIAAGALLASRALRPRPEGLPLAPAALPDGSLWVEHLTRDLAPFWTRPEALGTPVGAFPTFRCDDGTLLDPALPCSELAHSGTWISSQLGKEFTRMRSRQVFFYGVAYHLTGDPRMLELARAGVRWLRANALEPDGSAVSWWKGRLPDAAPLRRTSQDLAYANLGLAFWAYLTRDADVLADAVRLKESIFRTHDDPSFGMLRWVAQGPGGEAKRQELVAQLDQVNAYLLLLTPLVPEPEASAWRADLARLCRILVDRFWSEENGLFWGSLQDPTERVPGSDHTDFGHTVKALWMIERAGRLLGDERLVRFARERLPRLLARAYLPRYGCWASGYRRDGTLDTTMTWWTFAELDQATGTLALADRRYTGVLERTWACWRADFVDREAGEVWAFVRPDDPERHVGKQNQWKNGYHSAEHALVSYLVAQEAKGRPAVLHFAFRRTPERSNGDPPLRPYFFAGDVAAVSESPLPGFPDRVDVAVSFRNLR